MPSMADIRAEASHQRQLERIEARRKAKLSERRSQTRATTRVINVRSQAKVTERREAVRIKEDARAARTPEFDRPRPLQVSSSIAQHRREVAAQERAQAATQTASGGRSIPGGGVVRGLAHATPTVVQSASPGKNNLWLFMFLVFGLIIFYLLSTHPGQTQGLFGTLTSGVNALSSTRPLFTSSTQGTPTTNASGTSAPPGPSAGATNQTTDATSASITV